MRALMLALMLLVMAPLAARADTAAAPAMPTEDGAGSYRVVAIAAGAVAGVIVANAVTGGLATPVLVMGAGDAVLVPGGGFYLSAATAAVGALAGGYIGSWLYGH
ncbi:MAG: hypothetical protein U1E53_10520 [Dongiaceae bacterium]